MSRKSLRKYFRSGNNECPTCDREAKLVRHHINGREVHRAEEAWNIAWCCPTCHDMIHEKLLVIEGWFTTTEGRELIWHHKDDEGITGEEATPPSYSN